MAQAMDIDEQEHEQEPRRGGRARKVVERFQPGGDAAGNRSSKKDLNAEGSDEDPSDGPESEDEGRRRSKGKASGSGAARKARTPKTAGQKSKGKGKASGRGANGGEAAGQQAAEPSEGIKDDCALFNALLSADIALNTVIEEWVDTYQTAAGDEAAEKAAVHELIVCCLRSCGVSEDIDEDEAMDLDGVVDVVERIQDATVKTITASYPLILRTKAMKVFRTNLNIFISQLIKTISLTPILYATSETTRHTTPLLTVLLTWLHSMSSSPLRPLRHTSSYIALKINSALCEVAAEVSKELGLKQRQREAESRKGNTPAVQKKVKEAEKKVREVHERKTVLEEHMKEICEVMFVHRVRDSDAAIRQDCLKELGVWVRTYGEKFMTGAFLVYFSRGCNDPDTQPRLETVKALAALFARDTFATTAASTLLRLAPRLIEMALRDVDTAVRTNAVAVITAIERSGILNDDDNADEKRVKVARLIYDTEPRVRKAVGGFVRAMWEEKVEDLGKDVEALKGARKKRADKVAEEDMQSRLKWKALASILVETSNSLDEHEQDPSTSKSHMLPLEGGIRDSLLTRATAAVESLQPEIEDLQDWEALVEYLLLDHSASDEELWLLDDDEESMMLQVLVACVKRDSEDDEDHQSSKVLIKVLPRLFQKHQTDSQRVAGILSIIESMNLNLYLDMRMSSAYEALWDNVSNQYLKHTEPRVLTAAVQAVNHLVANSSMPAVNTAKLTELQETLFTSLRENIDGEVAMLSLGDEEISKLEAILLRISLLERSRDLVDVMEDEEGGQSSGWEIVCSFAERGQLGYKEEVKLVGYALNIVFLHLAWLFKRFTLENGEDEQRTDALREKRDRARDIFRALALREAGSAQEPVRRQALICFLNVHVLFSQKSTAPAAKAMPLEMEDHLQHKLRGVFDVSAERYAEELADSRNNADSVSDEHEFLFLQLASVYVAAIRTSVLEIEQAQTPLGYYGRFGPTYDAIVKKIVDPLRDEAIFNKQAEVVCDLSGAAVRQSFGYFLDEEGEGPTATIALAKLLASVFVVHGTHFSVLKQVNANDIKTLHADCIAWVCQKIGNYARQEKANTQRDAKQRLQKARLQCLTFFRVLSLMLGPISGRNAIELKAKLDSEMKQTGVEPATTKWWEPYRVYERRLLAIATKDDAIASKSRKVAAEAQAEAKKRKRSGVAATAEAPADTDAEDELSGDDEADGPQTPTRPVAKRPRQDPVTPVKTPTPAGAEDDDDDEQANGSEEEGEAEPENDASEQEQGDESAETAEQDDEVMGDYGLDTRIPTVEELDFDMELDFAPIGAQLGRTRQRSASADPAVTTAAAKKRKGRA